MPILLSKNTTRHEYLWIKDKNGKPYITHKNDPQKREIYLADNGKGECVPCFIDEKIYTPPKNDKLIDAHVARRNHDFVTYRHTDEARKTWFNYLKGWFFKK